MTNPHVLTAILVPFIAWRFYRRIRTNIGRQKFSPARSISILVIFSLVALLVAVSTRFSLNLLVAEAAGLSLGAVIGLVGLKLTVFNDIAEARYYTPNSYLGVGISVLLIGRIAYRLIVLASVDSSVPAPAASLGQSPLTLGLFGLTAGYYVAYHAGLLAKKSGTQSPSPQAE